MSAAVSRAPGVNRTYKAQPTAAAEVVPVAAAYGDAMKVELLQMATLMIRKAPGQLVQNRKEFIKFGWNNLKKDDSAVKYYAFQNVCHFFDAYAAPEKIVLQVGPQGKMSFVIALIST